ncbi:HpcH/HpaI aldolase/citrate lyase family protein [Brachybacterium aquaticum]|uniref:Citrate lyase subunit beta/citryl-CoA lyase n=1 Tax=Brachybacterium aquaticum TaxID=1432564 RepID=A0A841AI11_9MICO|nr:CoA ester lyase [Brachybacterium aquaticum]MBB5832920.1 citrate lyase subunit beta/citryl-CoA lyase [Brachybacterium aquaticum]
MTREPAPGEHVQRRAGEVPLGAEELAALGPALLFCPGDRPDRFAKAAARADAVILDLEDAVALPDKPVARAAVAAHQLDPARTIVRVNPARTAEFEADTAALAARRPTWVMLAKTESAADVGRLVARLPGTRVIALCETARGVLAAGEIAAHPDVAALMWGGEDLIASLGGTSSRRSDGSYRDVVLHARSAVLLAARAHQRAAIDAVHLHLADLEGLREEAEDAAASGFTATACLHPDQVAVVRAAHAPDPAQLARARDLLAAAAEHHGGVFAHEGAMVDEPLLRHARTLVARAEHAPDPEVPEAVDPVPFPT